MLVAHAEVCTSLVNKFVIRLLEARRYILDQDSASVQHCGQGSVLTPCTSAENTAEIAFCTQRSFLSDEA